MATVTATRLSVALLVAAIAGCQDSDDAARDAAALKARLDAPAGADQRMWKETRKFYELRQYQPMWTDGDKPSSAAQELSRVLAAAGDDGLNPADYDPESAREPKNGGDHKAAMERELLLTQALLRYSSDLAIGRPPARKSDKNWSATTRKIELAEVAQEAGAGGDLAELPARLAPPHPEYARLKETLRHYRKVAAGEAEAPPPQEPGAESAPPDERVRQIALNMERWRWLPAEFGATHVLVNVAGQYLQVREADKPVLEMRVITGKPENPTPIFSDTMTTVVFSPYWNIPQSIEVKEMWPAMMKDPDYFRKKQIEVVRKVKGEERVVSPSSVDWDDVEEDSILLRQQPGAKNALGHVKFIFPNHHSVYLHDTPNDNLFDRLTRDLSHGCVRVEKPVDLASYVLRDQPEWNAERIEEAMRAQEEKHVALKNPLPVHIVYLTARVDEDGVARFFDDVYGYDRRQQERLSHNDDRATQITERAVAIR